MHTDSCPPLLSICVYFNVTWTIYMNHTAMMRRSADDSYYCIICIFNKPPPKKKNPRGAPIRCRVSLSGSNTTPRLWTCLKIGLDIFSDLIHQCIFCHEWAFRRFQHDGSLERSSRFRTRFRRDSGFPKGSRYRRSLRARVLAPFWKWNKEQDPGYQK